MNVRRWFPFMHWLPGYRRETALQDGLAALIVTLMLIPQSLAYALLAGLPPQAGLYASILPLIAYALFGSSRTLAVGPVAVISLMTAAALTPLFAPGTAEYQGAALLLALLSGLLLVGMAVLRLGFLASFLSHPVISGFITASALLIVLSQLRHLFGIPLQGSTLPELLPRLLILLPQLHMPTLILGVGSLALLWWAGAPFTELLRRHGWSVTWSRIMPALLLVLSIAVVGGLGLAQQGVAVVGDIPRGLPVPQLPEWDWMLARQLLPAALLISLVGFVESVSVGQSLAARRRERIDPDNELAGLGAANLAAAVAGGLPVTGGFSRSVVNFDAGARTPMAGVFSAVAMAVGVLFFTPWLRDLPQAVLAATIIVAVLKLVDLRSLRRTWRYSRQDGAAQLATLLGVLLVGVEAGVLLGMGLSLLLFLWRTSRPHMAVVGQLPGSEHFRNVERFEVVQSPKVLSLRVDESLYFPNARYLEERIIELVAQHPAIEHLVLMCSGVNLIDASALESVEMIVERLRTAGIQLHLSEVKGPVMDRLRRSEFLQHFGGRVFVSQFQALAELDPEVTRSAMADAGTVAFGPPSGGLSDEIRPSTKA